MSNTPPSQGVPSLVTGTSINEPLILYSGPIKIRGREEIMEARIELQWVPEPRARIRIEAVDLFFSTADATCYVQIGKDEAEVLVLDYDSQSNVSSGILNSPLLLSEGQTTIDEAYCGLVNFHQFHGDPVVREGRVWRARLAFTAGEHMLLIDADPDLSARLARLKREGGYAVTHNCVVRRIDATPIDDLGDLAAALHFLFAFMSGLWAGPVLLASSPSSDAGVRYIQSPMLSRSRNVGSWFPKRPDGSEVSKFATEFMGLWNNDEWQMPLRHYIWWYIEANTAASLESAVLTSQAALELMGWAYLVETKRVISADGFNKLPAADKIRFLLSNLKIPLQIPAHLGHALQHATSIGGADGPGVVVDLRNAIVHPSLKKRTHLGRVGTDAKFQIAELSRQYVELVLLSMLQYGGWVRDRTARTVAAPQEFLAPWA